VEIALDIRIGVMNHKDIKMTFRYAKLADHSSRNEVDGLEF